MEAKLEALAGPLKGSVIGLTGTEISIGRDPSNVVSILDSSVSRRHCVIQRQEQQFTIRDLNSRNSTLVNGVPVKERVLEAGDEIKIGSSVFHFLVHASGDSSSSSVQLDASQAVCGSTIILRKEDAIYLNPGDMIERLPPSSRLLHDLNALLKISRTVSSVRGIEALQHRLLECIFELTPAERAAILLLDDSGEFTSMVGWHRQYGSGQPIQVSRTIAARVLEEGVAVFSSDVSSTEELNDVQSLIEPQVQSVVAVPLEVLDQVRGLIYLDSTDSGDGFDEHLLQLMTGIANIAAIGLENARHLEWLESENRRLQAEINVEHSMVGDSPQMREVYDFIAKVAPKDSTVLLCGESGTGKELVARAIHRNSGRMSKPYVAINCAALTETLLESELFGHEKGAFTGAISQKRGKLESADGGTVFLDEIGELAPSLQAKLLRVLQEREFERVGGTRPIKLDIRLIAATNRDLKEEVRRGRFRQDLYYRLNVVSLRMPALRERRNDIPLLASYFASKYCERDNRPPMRISPQARACLMHYEWPGNVRELENAIERAVVLASTNVIMPEDLPEAVLENAAAEGEPASALYEGLREVKKQMILKALNQTAGNHTEAAKLLGVHPNHLHRLTRNLNLKSKRHSRE